MEKTEYQATILANRLRKRQKHLRKWAKRVGTNAYRLYDRDIPEVPLVLDWYKDAVAGAYFAGEPGEDRGEWLACMQGAVAAALDLPTERVFLRTRQRQRGNSQYERLEHNNVFVDINEGDLVFRTNLSDYLDTGLFLDRRKLRALVQSEAGGKKVLNLFCYTGGFSVCAAAGGAASVDSVDLSNSYLDWAKVNFSLNRCTAELASPQNLFFKKSPGFRLLRSDVLRFLEDAARSHCAWDLIVLDPPVFSNSKKMTSDIDLKRDYYGLVTKCRAVLEKHGKLFFSANISNAPLLEPLNPRDLTESLRDEDFRGKQVPHCWVIEATHQAS